MSLRHMAVADYIYTELIRQTDLSSHIQSGGIMGRAEKKKVDRAENARDQKSQNSFVYFR